MIRDFSSYPRSALCFSLCCSSIYSEWTSLDRGKVQLACEGLFFLPIVLDIHFPRDLASFGVNGPNPKNPAFWCIV